MNPNSQLLLGIVLIGLGISIAVLAFMLLTGRIRERKMPPEGEGEEGEEAVEPPPVLTELETDYSDIEIQVPEPELSEEPVAITDEEISKPDSDISIEPEQRQELERESVEEEGLPTDIPVQYPSGLSSRTEVAVLLRDTATGALIVRVGDQEYASAAELSESGAWTRIEFAAKDLSSWIARTGPEETTADSDVEARAAKPKSMVEQINAILQQKIAETPGDQKAIRLIEGPDGSVRVLLGVSSYSLDEVPDSEARELIRQAVAAWEELQ